MKVIRVLHTAARVGHRSALTPSREPATSEASTVRGVRGARHGFVVGTCHTGALAALLGYDDVKLDGLTFVKAAHELLRVSPRDRGLVDEDVFPRVVAVDEAVAVLYVEPLDGAQHPLGEHGFLRGHLHGANVDGGRFSALPSKTCSGQDRIGCVMFRFFVIHCSACRRIRNLQQCLPLRVRGGDFARTGNIFDYNIVKRILQALYNSGPGEIGGGDVNFRFPNLDAAAIHQLSCGGSPRKCYLRDK
ncbi:unnamed protein product [Ixodes persulcatus]